MGSQQISLQCQRRNAVKQSKSIIFSGVASLIFGISVALATPANWELESDRAEMTRDRSGGAVYVIENPLIYPSRDQRLPMLTAQSAGFAEVEPSSLELSGSVRITLRHWTAYTDQARFDLGSAVFETDGVLTLVASGKEASSRPGTLQTVSFHCAGGHLFIDGEDQGEVTQANAVQIGPWSFFCNGDTLRTFVQVY
jgi:hypothetical protein